MITDKNVIRVKTNKITTTRLDNSSSPKAIVENRIFKENI